MDTICFLDLSFLSTEEQSIIQDVLARDINLKKCEEKRIRKFKQKYPNTSYLKLVTGEWFEDLKSKRYVGYSSATDLLKHAFQQKSGILTSRNYLSNKTFDSLKNIQITFSQTKRNKEKVERDNVSEELSITKILKDLELVLEQELDNVYLQECEDKRLETEGDLDLNDTFKTGMYSDFQSYTRPSIFDYSNIQWFCSSPCSLKDNVFAMEEVDLQESIPIILGSREIKALPSRSSTALDLHCNKCLANISIMSNHSALETESTIEHPTLLADSSPTLTEQ